MDKAIARKSGKTLENSQQVNWRDKRYKKYKPILSVNNWQLKTSKHHGALLSLQAKVREQRVGSEHQLRYKHQLCIEVCDMKLFIFTFIRQRYGSRYHWNLSTCNYYFRGHGSDGLHPSLPDHRPLLDLVVPCWPAMSSCSHIEGDHSQQISNSGQRCPTNYLEEQIIFPDHFHKNRIMIGRASTSSLQTLPTLNLAAALHLQQPSKSR